jgi:hypothetical protein
MNIPGVQSDKPFLSHCKQLGSLGDTAVPFLYLDPICTIKIKAKKEHVKQVYSSIKTRIISQRIQGNLKVKPKYKLLWRMQFEFEQSYIITKM